MYPCMMSYCQLPKPPQWKSEGVPRTRNTQVGLSQQVKASEMEQPRGETRAGFKPNSTNPEVIIIGNGPSAICLSYFLSGNWPYYTGSSNSMPHPDEALQTRLMNTNGPDSQSLVEQDLDYLSAGLEGRSSNPISLLFDSLSNPGADVGLMMPSQLRWEHHSSRQIPHLVLGRKESGGIWRNRGNKVDKDQAKTISLRSWMELPGMSFEDWINNNNTNRRSTKGDTCRASMADISMYYHDYVQHQGLTKYFRNYSTVTSLSRTASRSRPLNCECGEPEEEIESGQTDGTLWEICGYHTVYDDCGREIRDDFRYTAPNVVLATGAFDTPLRLGVHGENLPYILHSFHDLERRLERHDPLTSDPVVIVGSGLTAADAILMLRRRNIPMIHLHRGDNRGDTYRQLTPKIYPEYHEVYRLMHGEDTAEWYTVYSGVRVLGFTDERDVLIEKSGFEVAVKASLVVVLIGSIPDLTFICPSILKDLGVNCNMAIDGRKNRVNIDPLTYESPGHSGLYAMGPLVGDHMVRFIRGGALAITSHIWRKKRKNNGSNST